jgi:hypothetical protein
MSSLREVMTEKVYPFKEYDSGGINTGEAWQGNDIALAIPAYQMLIYPSVDSVAKFNGSAKEIFLPATTWTPIGFRVTSFNAKTVAGNGVLAWQGWY